MSSFATSRSPPAAHHTPNAHTHTHNAHFTRHPSRYKQTSVESAEAGAAEKALTMVTKQLNDQRRLLNRDLLSTQTKLCRAEALAASLELQLTEIIEYMLENPVPKSFPKPPKLSIDYGYYPDKEPTIRLRGCINNPDLRVTKRKKKGLNDMDDFLNDIDNLTL